MPAPRFARTVVVGDDAFLLAEITTLLAKRREYLPILNGPRLQRHDREREVTRRLNAIAKVRPASIIFAGLPSATCDLFGLPRETLVRRIQNADELRALRTNPRLESEPLHWGKRYIATGVLQVLRTRQRISFADAAPVHESVDLDASHIVVCEDGDSHAQVVAAAYALSIDAGLCVIPECHRDEADGILEALYSLSERPAPGARLDELRGALLAHIGPLDLRRKTVTFVTAKLPWGLAFPDVTTTHLFRCPELGIAIVDGIAAEQHDSPGVRSAVVIVPHSIDSADANTALRRLTDIGVLSKALRGEVAIVHQAAKTITLFPYDLLLIATHCSDAPGFRSTYEFVDTDGR